MWLHTKNNWEQGLEILHSEDDNLHSNSQREEEGFDDCAQIKLTHIYTFQ